MGVDWSHTPQTGINYHQTGPNMEPRRKEKKGRPRNTLRRELLTGIKKTGYIWRGLEKKAQDRRYWKTVVNDLCPRRSEG